MKSGYTVRLGVNETAMLLFAVQYCQKGWHEFAKDRATKNAAKSLYEKGFLHLKNGCFKLREEYNSWDKTEAV